MHHAMGVCDSTQVQILFFYLLGARSVVDKMIAAEMKKMPKPRDPASLFPDIELFKVSLVSNKSTLKGSQAGRDVFVKQRSGELNNRSFPLSLSLSPIHSILEQRIDAAGTGPCPPRETHGAAGPHTLPTPRPHLHRCHIIIININRRQRITTTYTFGLRGVAQGPRSVGPGA